MYKKIPFFILSVILFPILSNAQQVVWELPLEKSPNDIQAYEAGDSIFLLLKEPGVSYNTGNDDPIRFSNNLKAFWIDGQGKSYPLMFPDLDGQPLIGIVRESGGFRFYYFNKRQSQTIESLKYSVGASSGYVAGRPVKMQGRILAAFMENGDLVVLSYAKKERLLKYTKISGDQVIHEATLKVTHDLGVLKGDDIACTPADAFLPFSAGVGRVKISIQGDVIVVVVDETGSLDQEAKPKSSRTFVYQWNAVSGKVSNYFVKEPERYSFRSFFFDGHLYRTINHPDRFQLRVYDSLGKNVSTTTIQKNDSLKKYNAVFREGRARRISLDGTAYSMVDGSHRMGASLLVEKGNGNNLAVFWGAYFDDKGAQGPIGMSTSPFLAMGTMLAGTLIKQSMDGPGLSHYLYLTGTPDEGFRLQESDHGVVRAKIDSYEISQAAKEIRFKYKAYLTWGADKAGLYYDQTNKKLCLVKFSME